MDFWILQACRPVAVLTSSSQNVPEGLERRNQVLSRMLKKDDVCSSQNYRLSVIKKTTFFLVMTSCLVAVICSNIALGMLLTNTYTHYIYKNYYYFILFFCEFCKYLCIIKELGKRAPFYLFGRHRNFR